MNILRKVLFASLTLSLIAFSSCKKYKKYDDRQVVENTYTGTLTEDDDDHPDGDFTGNGDSGTYSFAWVNNKSKAEADFDFTSPTGSVQMIINDAKGDEVLNKTRTAGGEDSFSGVTSAGEPGTWLITLIITDLKGDGSYNVESKD